MDLGVRKNASPTARTPRGWSSAQNELVAKVKAARKAHEYDGTVDVDLFEEEIGPISVLHIEGFPPIGGGYGSAFHVRAWPVDGDDLRRMTPAVVKAVESEIDATLAAIGRGQLVPSSGREDVWIREDDVGSSFERTRTLGESNRIDRLRAE